MKYKIGQAVAGFDFVEEHEVLNIGCIIKIKNDEECYYIHWADGEEDWYSEWDTSHFFLQAKLGRYVSEEEARQFNLKGRIPRA